MESSTPAAGGSTTAVDCPTGSARCACYGNSTCNDGLICASDLCAAIKMGGGASGAGGTLKGRLEKWANEPLQRDARIRRLRPWGRFMYGPKSTPMTQKQLGQSQWFSPMCRSCGRGEFLPAMFILLHVLILAATVVVISRMTSGAWLKQPVTALGVAVASGALNFAIGWLLCLLPVETPILMAWLLLLFTTYVANMALLWLTDQFLSLFEYKSPRVLLLSAAALTAVSWLLQLPGGLAAIV